MGFVYLAQPQGLIGNTLLLAVALTRASSSREPTTERHELSTAWSATTEASFPGADVPEDGGGCARRTTVLGV